MQVGLFLEPQLPRAWREGDEHQRFHDALEWAGIAERQRLKLARVGGPDLSWPLQAVEADPPPWQRNGASVETGGVKRAVDAGARWRLQAGGGSGA